MPLNSDFPAPQMIELNGITLEVFEAGSHNRGNPIVLCHGWPELAYSWRAQIPALVAAGYHVLAPNQRGFGASSRPADVTDYDITRLTGDLAALLEHFGYEAATFVGHDWGANVVWSMALLHPERVVRLINLALPYQTRTPTPWIEFIEALFGADHFFVHFNRQFGVADAILDQNADQFLRNLFRKNLTMVPPEPGMMMINLARAETPLGDPLISAEDLEVFVSAFKASGFRPGINWYRNMDRNWHILAEIDPVIRHPALMIYGLQDPIPLSENLSEFVPNVAIRSLDCGHWIQQERPEETTQVMLEWLKAQDHAG
jgi:pimeloyl-ACP methyl ester carboxylesterase